MAIQAEHDPFKQVVIFKDGREVALSDTENSTFWTIIHKSSWTHSSRLSGEAGFNGLAPSVALYQQIRRIRSVFGTHLGAEVNIVLGSIGRGYRLNPYFCVRSRVEDYGLVESAEMYRHLTVPKTVREGSLYFDPIYGILTDRIKYMDGFNPVQRRMFYLGLTNPHLYLNEDIVEEVVPSLFRKLPGRKSLRVELSELKSRLERLGFKIDSKRFSGWRIEPVHCYPVVGKRRLDS